MAIYDIEMSEKNEFAVLPTSEFNAMFFFTNIK